MSDKSLNLHLIGKIHSAQGVCGQVFVTLIAKDVPWLKKWKELYLTDTDSADSNLQTYKIKNAKAHFKQGKAGWVLTLENFTNKDQADPLVKKRVWIPSEFLKSQAGETLFLREIENFLVVDKERGVVGPIVGFSSNGPQDLIQIEHKNKVFEVPLVKPFIEKISAEEKKIYMNIPMGLLEDL